MLPQMTSIVEMALRGERRRPAWVGVPELRRLLADHLMTVGFHPKSLRAGVACSRLPYRIDGIHRDAQP